MPKHCHVFFYLKKEYNTEEEEEGTLNQALQERGTLNNGKVKLFMELEGNKAGIPRDVISHMTILIYPLVVNPFI